MACWFMVLFLFATQFPGRAERLNGVNLEEAQVEVDCLTIRYQDAGVPDFAHLEAEYYLRFEVKNRTDQPCLVEPMRFRIVDADEKEFDAKEVFIRYRQVEEEQSETMRPGDAWEYAIVFGAVRLEDTRPARLFYKERLLGELTK
ncbi:MAG: hypothetical protein ACRD1R_14870 [Acidobacteriota bacterium]